MNFGEFLRSFDLHPRKKLGQHFLHDDAILRSIVEPAQIDPEKDLICEIGPGPGTLTAHLVETGARVVAVELDPRFREPILGHLGDPPNLVWLDGDCLARKNELSPVLRDLLRKEGAGLTKRLVLISNLPYSISVPAIVNLIEEPLGLRAGVVTVQAEVGDRLLAKTGAKDYGPVAVFMGATTKAKKLRTVRAGSFWPPPKVSSSVIYFDVCSDWRVTLEPYQAFRKVVWGLFRYRRKTISGAIRNLAREQGAEVPASLLEAIDSLGASRRPERLELDEFRALASAWHRCWPEIKRL